MSRLQRERPGPLRTAGNEVPDLLHYVDGGEMLGLTPELPAIRKLLFLALESAPLKTSAVRPFRLQAMNGAQVSILKSEIGRNSSLEQAGVPVASEGFCRGPFLIGPYVATLLESG